MESGGLAYTRRAVREEQKEERRRDLLAAAWRSFRERPYGEITVGGVASEAGLAKGTVYLYFKTKEEIFLSVQEDQLSQWFDELDGRLEGARGRCDAERVSSILCGSLEERPGLVRLLAMMHGVLEQNVDYETALRFKRMLLARVTRTGGLLEECLPFLGAGEGAGFLLRAHAFVIGLHNLAAPSPVVERALAEPDLGVFRVDFATELSGTLRTLLAGMENDARRASKAAGA